MSLYVVVFGIDEISLKYFDDFKKRISNEKDFFKNPFKGRAHTFLKGDTGIVVIEMNPKYPPFFVVGLAPLVLGFILRGGLVWSWMSSVGLAFLCLGFFWSPLFYFLMMKIALKRKGYKRKLRWIRPKSALRRVMDCAV